MNMDIYGMITFILILERRSKKVSFFQTMIIYNGSVQVLLALIFKFEIIKLVLYEQLMYLQLI